MLIGHGMGYWVRGFTVVSGDSQDLRVAVSMARLRYTQLPELEGMLMTLHAQRGPGVRTRTHVTCTYAYACSTSQRVRHTCARQEGSRIEKGRCCCMISMRVGEDCMAPFHHYDSTKAQHVRFSRPEWLVRPRSLLIWKTYCVY